LIRSLLQTLSWAELLLIIHLNVLFPNDSTKDLADELDEFFRFMIWNGLSEEECEVISLDCV
jgi:hypothetical protein